ncbi:MAG: HlyD family efflux transporter periplasmic adaptor subunit [Leptolyngbya sp. SIO1E4]|nr:HlyD family efflux transporter periplasmic adaptor subunit [Leptolyngbya sp. SIO1E4]
MTPTPRISQNGQVQNGQVPSKPEPTHVQSAFDRSVILRQSPRWARYVVWGIVGVSVATVTWACLAKIEEAIPAQGKLEPRGVVQPVQAPVGGVVDEIRVNEGERVEQGQVLVTLDPRASQAELASLKEVRKSLVEENEYYRVQLNETSEPTDDLAVDGIPTTVSPEMARLTSNRVTLIEENQLYRAILQGNVTADNLSPEQRERLRASLGGLSSEIAINQLEADQLIEQLAQTRIQLANAIQGLGLQRTILDRLEPLVEAGAIADLQYWQQEQEVNNSQTEVNSLRQEEERILLAITQAEEQLRRTAVVSDEELLDRIAANDTQIANIDSQLTKIIVENDKQLEELDGQISRLEYAIENQELRAPLAGQVFNLRANQPGYVANATEPILEIVPDDTLVARVFITNRDIGFVRQQFDQEDTPLTVDVRIDSFPFSEFGDVDGTVTHIGSDALPPDQVNPVYRFPTEIDLESQTLGDALTLQSGMAVTANIKLRERRVITILSDLFVRKIDSLRSGS